MPSAPVALGALWLEGRDVQGQPTDLIGAPPRDVKTACLLVLALVAGATGDALGQWVQFQDETSSRLSAALPVGADDVEEKAYAWGDLDRDGDTDLVVARKQPWVTSGKKINVLLINQEGVLTDRTAEFAVEADIEGDEGFLTPTNDRDVALADVNLDGWLDVITAPTMSDGDPKHIGHPRVYINRCCAVGGCAATACSTDTWLGLRYEAGRIPTMLSDSGQSGFNPCFTAVSAGDVTGDGYPDLYFSDHDEGCAGGNPGDFNDKLLVNLGTLGPGFFKDLTEARFVGSADVFPLSGFGTSGGVAKLNEDDGNDILKHSQGNVANANNDADHPGSFSTTSSPYGGSSYFVSHGDLNNDDKVDLVVSNDNADRYLLNTGDGGDGIADFIAFGFSFSHSGAGGPSSDNGFAGNSVVADLNNDGFNDVLITDVEIELPGCTNRRMQIYKNLGGPPGGHVVLQEQTSGSGCESIVNPPTCLVVGIPANKLKGTHDVAVFDIDGDGWKDMVVGRCTGTAVYMNVPPPSPAGAVPDGDGVAGSMLTLDRDGDQITLSWGPSCSPDDNDYSVYQGALGDFGSHVPVVCSTRGSTRQTLAISSGPQDAYYLVAPRNDAFQGSLGKASDGTPHQAGESACLPQFVGVCPEQ